MKDSRIPTATSKRRPRRTSVKSPGEEKGSYYILATERLADEATRVLMHGDTFAVFDHYGDIKPSGLGEQGIFHEGTRFLSRLILELGAYQPMFLSSTVKQGNDVLAVDLTNPDVFESEQLLIPRGNLHLLRSKFLSQGVCYECVHLRNYGAAIKTTLTFHFEADYADIFEVRGTRREKRGRTLKTTLRDDGVELAYEGLDKVVRRSRLQFAPRPGVIENNRVRFEIMLQPREEAEIYLTVVCERDGGAKTVLPYSQALAANSAASETAQAQVSTLQSTNDEFNDLLHRSVADLNMMTVLMPTGPYPYAGVPWFGTAFGRDGIITALECLWLNPGLARGVLAFLAATQATEVIPEQDAEPGKILHETRMGEMAALREIPFGKYYGSVDATPLFLVLAGAYYTRTGDRAFIESIWANLEAALQWLNTCGDRDGDGLIEYDRRSSNGLVHQGWKDSNDSVFHADGSPAAGPIALCEVQGYAFAARQAMVKLATVLGKTELAEQLHEQARKLQEKFASAFWCDELSTYALALDGNKRACRVRASNAGHCLLTGIATSEHAKRLVPSLMSPEFLSGWGIRTLAVSEARFNPMSYHNGSIWPHDNALIAAGMARYGFTESAMEVASRVFDASLHMDLFRLPELFCGFERRVGEGPTLYPVACSPQAWAAGSIFLLLQSCLGVRIDGVNRRVSFSYPFLPAQVNEISISNLHVGEASVNLVLRRIERDVSINVTRRVGKIEIKMVK
jgi:glycogen debranching enzyme